MRNNKNVFLYDGEELSTEELKALYEMSLEYQDLRKGLPHPFKVVAEKITRAYLNKVDEFRNRKE